jgi:hypothetical protein
MRLRVTSFGLPSGSQGQIGDEMIAEKLYSLSAAARLVGVRGETLKRWLRQDLNICLPRVRNGSKILIRERDIERVVARRRDARTR